MELLESNNLLAGWSGFELRSTPLQSKKITGRCLDQSAQLARVAEKSLELVTRQSHTTIIGAGKALEHPRLERLRNFTSWAGWFNEPPRAEAFWSGSRIRHGG